MDSIKTIREQPVVINVDTLHHGHYYPRRASIWHRLPNGTYPEGATLIMADDIPMKRTVIDFADLHTNTENFFTVSPAGMILHCAYPERTVTGDPSGFNIYDILLPKYCRRVRAAVRIALRKKIETPIEYMIEVGGQRIYERGTVKYAGGNVVFRVVRMATPKNSGHG